jgi:hypothetical protein
MAALLGDDQKKRVTDIIEGTSIPKPTPIDNDLEPIQQLRANRNELRFVDMLRNELAPAEPLDPPEPVDAGALAGEARINFGAGEGPIFIDNNGRLNRVRGRRIANGPENPQQVPRGPLPPDFNPAPEPPNWDLNPAPEPPNWDLANIPAEWVDRQNPRILDRREQEVRQRILDEIRQAPPQRLRGDEDTF